MASKTSSFEPEPGMHCADCNKTHPPRAALVPSPFQSFIADERLPTASERTAICDFVQDIDAGIEWRERTVDRLLCEVAELRRRSEHHKAITAPIRRVPPEVMAEIFLQLTTVEVQAPVNFYPYDDFDEVATFFERDTKIRPVLHGAPLIFGEICRHWRAIALSTPKLWNSICLNCTNEKIQANIPLCDMWLKRSGSLPLTIRLYRPYRQNSSDYNIEHWRSLMSTILAYAHRWRLLDFKNVPVYSLDVGPDLPDSLPTLETLSFGSDPLREPRSAWACLRSAPKLRLLHLERISLWNDWNHFPWPQLTHIDVGGCSALDCLNILTTASSAVVCAFFIDEYTSLNHCPSVLHSSLQTLKIKGFDGSDPLWKALTCPILSTLAIDIDDTDDFPSFLARSGATVQKFTLVESNMSDTQFLACVANMPRLRQLNFSEQDIGTKFSNEICDALTLTPNSSLLPDLESLKLVGGTNLSQKALVRMLQSRVRTTDSPAGFVSKLKTIDLAIWRKLSHSTWQQLTALRSFGLNVILDAISDDEGESGGEASDAESEELDE
ncbi:hypothetical protein C8R45DRAFT_73503 [Mycena sanguinolenta]|nr:hypothetical protein C8R45DRAFT_73503 [Mycena sanguinolenta]